MPVRRTIHSESTPMRSAIAPLVTTRSGSLWPRPTTRAVRAGASRPFSRCASTTIAGMHDLGRRLHLRAGDDPLGQAREHLAGPDLDEPRGAGVVQRGVGLAPADRADERARE